MTFIKDQTAWNKGKKMSKETRSKISNSLQGREAWNKGKSWSDATKKKISEAKKGQPAWNKGMKWSEEVIAKIKASLAARKQKVEEKEKKGNHFPSIPKIF